MTSRPKRRGASRRDPFLLACAFAFAVLAALSVAASPAGAQMLGPRTDLNTGAVPRSVEIADVDEDGHPDIVVAVQGGNEISIFRGNGDLTFQPRLDVPTAANPIALAVVDWTGDGNLDLLVGCADSTLRVYAGNGAGAFAPGASVHCPTVPWEVEAGDVTGDGRLDAIVSADEPSVALFDVPGTAGGGFGTPRIWLTDAAARSRSLALGEIDGQPGLDIYLGTQQGASRILRNDGAGGFLAPQMVSGSAASYGVALGDWSGDGTLDVVEVGPALTEGRLRMLRGVGGGAFALETDITAPANPRAPSLADLDGDPGLDVAFVSSNLDQFVLALSNCDFAPNQFAYSDLTPEDLALGDLDHDGDPDFVTANFGGASVSIRRNEGPGEGCTADPDVQPTSVQFALLAVGTPTTFSLNVRNLGDAPFVVTGATVGTAEFTVLTAFPVNVPPHSTRGLEVRSNRLAIGTFHDTLRIATNDDAEPELLVPLSTSAREPLPPRAVFQASDLVFPLGPVGFPATKTLKITNVGEQILVVSSATTQTPEFVVGTALPFPISIGPGVTTNISVTTQRTSVGTAQDVLHLEMNDPLAPKVDLPLEAETRPLQPSPVPSPTTLTFGADQQGTQEVLFFTLSNPGELTFAVTAVTSPSPQFQLVVNTLPFSVSPGASMLVGVRYLRSAVGTHSGMMTFFTDDPSHPQFGIFLTGSTTVGNPPRAAFSGPVDFGPVIAGAAALDSAWIEGRGATTVTVSSLTTSTPAFTVLAPATPFTLTSWGDLRHIRLRFQGTEVGEARDTLVIVSNEADDPVHRVPLLATVIPPPAIGLLPETLAPVELAAGAATSRTIQVLNGGSMSTLSVDASTVVDSVVSVIAGSGDGAGSPPPEGGGAGTATLPAYRLDPEGHAWDVRGDGSIGTGDAGAFDAALGGGLAWTGYPVLAEAEMRDGGRAFHLSTTQGGLVLERTVHVSPMEPWIRYLDTVTNPGPVPVVVSIPLRSRLDLAIPRSTGTSSGDLAFQTFDDWIVVEDDVVPTIAHVIAGPGGLRPSSVQLTSGTREVRYTFTFTLASGQSGSILHYALQAATRAEAIERAEALRTPFGPALAGLDIVERSRIRNFAMTGPFSLPFLGSLFVPPGEQRGLVVGFDAGQGSGAEETVFGTLRLVTNIPGQPLVTVPLELRISAATGPDPLPVVPLPGATLALAARFVPNPVRSGRVELSYVLPSAGTARFDLYDVRGRRIASRVVPDAPAGPGSIRWGALEGSLPAGVVWMRLTHGARTVTTKAVVLP